MIRRLVIAIVMGLMVASSAFAGTFANWELVYEHDGQGVKTSGDLNALVAAVKSGADVKVISHSPASGDSNYILGRSTVDLSGTVVTGGASELYSNMNDPVGAVYNRFVVFSTTGEIKMRYQGATNMYTTVNFPQSWYVSK